jgi:hypothetical protein
VPIDLIKVVKRITEIILLENLLKKAVKVENMEALREVLRKADINYQ